MPTLSRRRALVAFGAVLAVTALLGSALAALSVRVSGASMHPTLHDGDRVLLRPFSGGDTPKRGALVVARFAEHGPRVVKRVIALPGDRVEIRAGSVRLQPGGSGPWFVVRNPAWGDADLGETDAAQVPAGSVFVLGDDPGSSTDSRQEGWVRIGLISGRVWWRIHPLTRLGPPDGGISLRVAN